MGTRGSAETRAKLTAKADASTTLWRLGRRTLNNAERIGRFDEAPWHRNDETDAKRVTIKAPPTTPDTERRERWAEARRTLAYEHRNNPDSIFLYTDGSLRFDRGIRRTGLGYAGIHNNIIASEGKDALGPQAEVYDAEMEALATAAEHLDRWIRTRKSEQLSTPTTIHILSDNTGALQRIYKGTPGLAQAGSKRFRQSIHNILDRHPLASIILTWVPGHEEIRGNERADKLAKDGAGGPPKYPGFMSAAFAKNIRRRELKDTWIAEWAGNPARQRRSEFLASNRFELSLNPTSLLTSLNRRSFSRLCQCRTGHAHIGSYYRRFVPTEASDCECGYYLKTREHIIMDCPLTEEHRHTLYDEDNIISTDDLLGTMDGLERLTTFLDRTKAYDKQPA